MAKDRVSEGGLFLEYTIIKDKIIKTRANTGKVNNGNANESNTLLKIVILIVVLIYFLLAQPLVVTGNTTEDNIIKNVGNNATNNSIKSVEPNKDKETITISVRNASLKDTVLGICRSYGISVIGEHKTLLIESEDTALENRELYVVSPEHLPAESLSNIMGTVVKNDKMAVLSEQNEVIMHLTSGEKRRVETLINAVDKEPKQVQLEATIIAMEQSYAKEQGFRWSWLSLTGHGEDKTNSYGAVTFGKTPGGEAYKFFVKPELSLMESSGKAVLIAKPSIMALNGETAHILIGERIPVIEEAEVNGERKRSTRYEEVGIKLNYTPIITANGGVDAKIHAEVSTPIMVSEMKAYKISTRQAHTRVRLQPGEVLVIGGLMDNRDQHQIQKIPILGDIPLLGKLFRHSRKTKDSIEMLILVRANVV